MTQQRREIGEGVCGRNELIERGKDGQLFRLDWWWHRARGIESLTMRLPTTSRKAGAM